MTAFTESTLAAAARRLGDALRKIEAHVDTYDRGGDALVLAEAYEAMVLAHGEILAAMRLEEMTERKGK
jgi:hypothetical protein